MYAESNTLPEQWKRISLVDPRQVRDILNLFL